MHTRTHGPKGLAFIAHCCKTSGTPSHTQKGIEEEKKKQANQLKAESNETAPMILQL